MQTCLRTSTAITVSISSAPSASNTKALAAILPSEIHLLQYQGFVPWQAENQLVEFHKSRSLRGGWVPTCPASAVSWLGPFLLSAIWRNRGSEGGSWAEAGLTVAKRCYIKPNWRYYQVLPSLGRQFKLALKTSLIKRLRFCVASIYNLYDIFNGPILANFCSVLCAFNFKLSWFQHHSWTPTNSWRLKDSHKLLQFPFDSLRFLSALFLDIGNRMAIDSKYVFVFKPNPCVKGYSFWCCKS